MTLALNGFAPGVRTSGTVKLTKCEYNPQYVTKNANKTSSRLGARINNIKNRSSVFSQKQPTTQCTPKWKPTASDK